MPSQENAFAHALRGIRAIGVRNTLQSAFYPLRRTFHQGSFSKGGSSPSLLQGLAAVLRGGADRPPAQRPNLADCDTPGDVVSAERDGQVVTIRCERASLQITVLAADTLRVRYGVSGTFATGPSYSVCKTDDQWVPVPYSVDNLAEAVEIRTDLLLCRVSRSPCRVSFLDDRGTPVHTDARGMAWSRDRIALSTALVPGAQILGLGEKACGQDRRGRTFTLWNTDPQNYQPGADPLYLSIPMFIALVDGRAHSVFYDNSYRASLDVGATQNDELLYAADGGELCYYYFHGPALPQVLERYTELTGRPALPPLWSLGFQQSRWSYFPADRVREVARLLREHRIPCDALYLDIHYMDGYRVFTWDRHRFPDPTGLLADLHRQGFRVVLAVDPHVKSDRSYRICADGLMKRVFCTYPDGRPAGGPVWPGEAFFPDFTAERVRWWWGDLFSDLLDDGVDGFWNDMNEPTIIGPSGDTLADCVRHDWEGQGADHRQAHNVYGQLTARATAEGLRRLRPNSRTFVLTRSGWAGVQRDAFSWTGDNKSTWEHLRLSLPMVLGKGLSGLAFTGADVGGFDGDAEGELLVRWTQMGAFLPLFRNHASIWSRDQEPWAFGESYLGPIRDAIELRYRLLPYLYTAAWQCSQTGAPPARPLAWAFPSDPHACQLDSQFLCGDSLLVAPVVERGATCRQVYLPRETWFDYWTGQRHPGPITLHAESPLERIPLWVRGGTVLPTWPLLQHTGEAEPDRLFLDVYSGNGKSVLYEDDGLSQAYTRGDLRVTEFRQRLTDADLEITASRHGGYCPSYGLCEWRVFGLSQPSQVEVDERPLTNWRWFPDQPGGVLSFETGPLVQRVVIRFASAPAAP